MRQLIRCTVAAPATGLGLSQLHQQIGVSASGAARIDASVERCRRSQTCVPQELPDQFVSTGFGVENDFCGEMAELMRRDFHPKVSHPGLLDRDRNRSGPLRLPPPGHKDGLWALAGHERSNLVSEHE